MKSPRTDYGNNQKEKYLLALHSSSETLGVALLKSTEINTTKQISTFPLGRLLSKNLLSCVQELLPSEAWSQIVRLGVAIGPGGFTGTRLSVVMARTLAQQLGCSLDGVSSFSLMAPRLATALNSQQLQKPFWIVQKIPRRGIVAGCYQLRMAATALLLTDFLEIEAPRLFPEKSGLHPQLEANDDVAADVGCLLDYCSKSYELDRPSPWGAVLPLYPTSPVENR